MFGTKRRREERERALEKKIRRGIERDASRRPDRIGAIREVLASTGDLLLRPPGAVVRGSQGQCSVGLGKETNVEFAAKVWAEVKQAFGETYKYSILVTAQCPTAATQLRAAFSPDWRSYADEYRPVHHSFDSIEELMDWIKGDGSITRDRQYQIYL